MKFSLLFLVFSLSITLTSGQGIDFKAHSWEEAKAMASEQGKIIFVDCYTTWCGPCKRLAKNLFPQAEVGDYYNEHFISLKMNMETPEGQSFGRKYSVSSYPTLYFIAPDGEVVQKTKGAPRDVQSLLAIAQNATSKYDPSALFMERYEAGDRSASTYLGLIQQLNRAGKSSLKYTNAYLRNTDDHSSDTSVQIIYHGLTQVDSRVFDHFMNHLPAIRQQQSSEDIADKVKSALLASARNAAIFESEDVLQEGIDKYAKVIKAEDGAEDEARLVYALELADADGFTKRLSKMGTSSPVYAAYLSAGMKVFSDDEDTRSTLKKAAKGLAKDAPTADHLLLYAEFCLLDKDNASAMKVIDQLAKEELTLDAKQQQVLKNLSEKAGA